MSLPTLDDSTLDDLHKWLEGIPFSRPRKHLARDFSDGLMVAELVAFFLPGYVQLHNYVPANSTVYKRYNWETLSKKVFSRLKFQVLSHVVQQIIACKPGAIEFLLLNLRIKIELTLNGLAKHCRLRSLSASRESSLLSLTATDKHNGDECPTPISSGYRSASRLSSTYDNVKSSPRTECQSTFYGSEDLIPAKLLHEAKQTILKKEEIIKVMQARVEHLEKLSDLKQERIDQLTDRIDLLSDEMLKNNLQIMNDTSVLNMN